MRYLVFFGGLIALASCSQEPSVTGPTPEVIKNDTTSTVTVQDSLIATPVQDSVQLELTHTSSWCNGFYPSDEALADLKSPKRLYYMPLILTNGQESWAIRTDKKGRAKVALPPGDYTVRFDPDGDYKKAPLSVTCDAWFEPEWGSIHITETDSLVRFNIELPCDLCDPDAKKRP